MQRRYFLAAAIVLAAGYAVMVYRLWRRNGVPRAVSLVPQSRWGMVRILILVTVIVLIVYFRFVQR